MPKLKNIDDKYVNGIKVDKETKDVIYSDEQHVYVDKYDSQKYISVTTLIGKYENPFDVFFWSSYKTCEKLLSKEVFSVLKETLLATKKWEDSMITKIGLDPIIFEKTRLEIQQGYDNERRKSCERGTKIHSEFEELYYKSEKQDLKKFGLGGVFTCKKGYYELDLEKGIYPEFLISLKSSDGILRVAGQIDLLIKDGNDIYIYDYKGLPLDTKIPTKTGWTTIKDIKEGEEIFDKDGNLTKVIHKSGIHYNPCFKITFDNGESIVADHEHRWLISFRNPDKTFRESVLTTEELAKWLIEKPRTSYNIPKIRNAQPLNLPDLNLPIDPYVLGCWLGDGSKSCGIITNTDERIWEEIQNRGYSIEDNLSDLDHAKMRTVYNIRKILNELGVLHNKFIPDLYMRASYQQRLDLLRGLMDTDGYYHESRKRFVMGTTQKWQAEDLLKLVSTLGIKATIFEVNKKCNGKTFKGWDVCFSTNGLNPFLIRNQNIKFPEIDKNSFRNIISVERVDTVATQCLEVDSLSHTFLFGESMIVTHNTNKELKKKSYYDQNRKQNIMMKYPLNNIMDCNYYHYTLQLSLYAYLLQQIKPELNIKKLTLIYINHDNEVSEHEVQYLKTDVIRMLKHYKKTIKQTMTLDRDKPIEF